MICLTEDQIERRVERMMEHLDRLLLNGDLSQEDYDKAVVDLRMWVVGRQLEAAFPWGYRSKEAQP